MPRAGAGVFGGTTKPVLEIKPYSPFVVLYGEATESQSAEVAGKLILNSADSMSVKSIKMSLTGMRKVSWSTTKTVTPQPFLDKSRFLYQTLNLTPVGHKSHKINAGHHEWDFKFTLPGDTDESVEGLATNWIVYDLQATVDRGYMSKQLMAISHIRVIRTLSRDLTETQPMEQINEDIWGSKLCYKITVPQKNYIVGTSITADFVLIPLRKGVEIDTIKMELVETRSLFADYAGRRMHHSFDTTVASKTGEMPANSVRRLPNGLPDAELFDESHRFKMTLDLPKSLKDCRQSVETENIKLSHKLRIYVNLLNPEGHTSQLLVKNCVHLFISPNLPPNHDQSVVVDHDLINSAAIRDELSQNAPPTYGLHQMDELYNDIDPSGFMTPGGPLAYSGGNTPLYPHSRAGSYENLASLNALAEQEGGGASATALHYRLSNLNLTQNSNTIRHGRQHSTGGQQSSGGNTPRFPENTLPTPPTGYFANASYDMDALVRTPSYNTAVRTPARTPISEDLPTYEHATSRPSSPTRGSPPGGTSNRSSGRSSPGSPQSLDTLDEDGENSLYEANTLTEETQRNTQLNARRAEELLEAQSDDSTPRSTSVSSASSSESAISIASSHSTNSSASATPSLSTPSLSTSSSSSNFLSVPGCAGGRKRARSRSPTVTFREEDTDTVAMGSREVEPQSSGVAGPLKRILKKVV